MTTVFKGSVSGRFSSENPNMSQQPKSPAVFATFSTDVVMTTITSVVVSNGLKMGELLRCAEWILGRTVLLHELSRPQLYEVMYNLVKKQYPDIPPATEFESAPKSALRVVEEHYGATLSVKRRVVR